MEDQGGVFYKIEIELGDARVPFTQGATLRAAPTRPHGRRPPPPPSVDALGTESDSDTAQAKVAA